jgi:hypothetical protein
VRCGREPSQTGCVGTSGRRPILPAIRALQPLVATEDVDWVLDLYFSVPGWLLKHEMVWLVTSLPPEGARRRLVAGLEDPVWQNRHAAVKAIGHMAYEDRKLLIGPLRNDPTSDVRRSVNYFVEQS